MASLIQAPGPCRAFEGHQLQPGLGYLVPGGEGKSLPLAELWFPKKERWSLWCHLPLYSVLSKNLSVSPHG